MLGEYDGTGQPLAEYAWLGDLPVALRRYAGEPAQAELYAIETDHLGTPRMLTDASQRIRWRWHSSPFGDTAPDENPEGHGPLVFNLRFPGQYFDAESGLHYNYFRDYDPQSGRYVQSDPIGLAGGINTYGYVNGNPLSFADPEGLTGTLVLPRPIFAPRPIPIPAQSVDPSLPVPNIESIPDTPKDPFGEYCRSLAKRIKNSRDEIYGKRFPDLQSNPQSLPQRIGPGEKLSETVRGHEKLLNRRLRELRNLEDEFDKNCVPLEC